MKLRVLLLAMVLCMSVPVAAVSPLGLQSVAAAECVYDGWGKFTGDCYFDPIPDDPRGCQVSYANRTYSNGCQVRPEPIAVPLPSLSPLPSASPSPGASPEPVEMRSHFWSPTDLGAGCSPLDGGFYCPFEGDTYDPAPGYSCTYDELNANWKCNPPGPPGEVNCDYVEADGVQNCTVEGGAPIPPDETPDLSGECATDAPGGGNLVCNGDFEDDIGNLSGQGQWTRKLPGDCVDTGWQQYAPGRSGQASYLYIPGAFGECGPLRTSRIIQQVVTLPPGATGIVDITFWLAKGPRVPGNEYDLINYCAWEEFYGNNRENGYWVTGSTGQTGCANSANWEMHHARFTIGGTGANGEYRLSFRNERNGKVDVLIDDVVVTFTQTGGPAPSPSPSPGGGGAQGGNPLPSWDCDYNGTATFGCTAPPDPISAGSYPGAGSEGGRPVPLSNCVFDPASGIYTCDGPPPASGPGSASPSPNPSGSPAPSGSPGTGGGSPRPSYGPSAGSRPSPGAGADTGKPCQEAMQVLAALIAQGVPYCWGSNDPVIPITQQGYAQDSLCPEGRGLDCSGAIVWAWREVGVNIADDTAQGMYDSLPHTACTLDDLSAPSGDSGGIGSCWAVGDLVFLGAGGSSLAIYHVAAYAGGGLWNDCYSTSTGCQTWPIDSKADYRVNFAGSARPSLAWGGGECGDGGSVVGGGSGPGGVGGVAPGVVASRLQPLYQKEPIGTLMDVGNFVVGIKDVVQAGDVSAVPVENATGTGLFSAWSVAGSLDAMAGFLDWIADLLEGIGYGPINGLALVRLGFASGCVFALIKMVRKSVVVAA